MWIKQPGRQRFNSLLLSRDELEPVTPMVIDGDRVRITKLTVSKPECLKVTRDGKKLYATPQGKITGQTPILDGANYCDVRIRVQVSDGRGGTNIRPSAVRRPLSADFGPAPGQTE